MQPRELLLALASFILHLTDVERYLLIQYSLDILMVRLVKVKINCTVHQRV
jgi:hypothetical protein